MSSMNFIRLVSNKAKVFEHFTLYTYPSDVGSAEKKIMSTYTQ